MAIQKISFLSIFLIFSQLISSFATNSTVYPISDLVEDDSNYSKADFQIDQEESSFYFKYSVSGVPSSLIGAFRFDLGEITQAPEILCKFFEDSSTDTQIISELDSLDIDNSACIGGFNNGIYDGEAHGITVTSSGAIIKYGTESGTYELDERGCYEYAEGLHSSLRIIDKHLSEVEDQQCQK